MGLSEFKKLLVSKITDLKNEAETLQTTVKNGEQLNFFYGEVEAYEDVLSLIDSIS